MKPLKEIERLVDELFRGQHWRNLHGEGALDEAKLRSPGVYLLAHSADDLEGKPIAVRDVLYVGMSNAPGGVQQRLKRFKIGIEKNTLHSGAKRFYRMVCRGKPYSEAKTGKIIFFPAKTVPCVSRKDEAKPDDFRVMGHVACLEQYAIAHCATENGRTPSLNKLGASEFST